MSASTEVLLEEWGDGLFYKRRRGLGRARNITQAKFERPKKHQMAGAARYRNLIALASRRAPEVMVKISGGGKGMRQIKAHLDYISRNGLVALENEDGQTILGREAVRDLRDEWKYGQYGIPDQARRKEAFNIVLSMPPGTDRAAVRDAARAFAKTQFGENHPYVFASHDDERHPHVHLCVKSLGYDGTRLNPRKEDLQAWREQFAEKLREQGIEANATPRVMRGVNRKAKTQRRVQFERRGFALTASPAQALIDKSANTHRVLGSLARALATGNPEDQKLALEVTAMVREMNFTSAPTKGVEVATGSERPSRDLESKDR